MTNEDLDKQFNRSLNERFPNLFRVVALDDAAFAELQELRRTFERLAVAQFAKMAAAYIEALGATISGDAKSEADVDRIMREKLGDDFPATSPASAPSTASDRSTP